MTIHDDAREAIRCDKGGPHAQMCQRLLDEIERLRKDVAYWQEEARRYAGNAEFWRERCEAIPGEIDKAMK